MKLTLSHYKVRRRVDGRWKDAETIAIDGQAINLVWGRLPNKMKINGVEIDVFKHRPIQADLKYVPQFSRSR